jgi:cytochrome c
VISHALVAFALGLVAATPALADGDAEEGKRVFNRCMACHDGKREVNKVGPHLVGVVGRKAGSLESFVGKYSDAMVAAGAAGLVWDEANLAAYLKAPKDFIPGNRMSFVGIKDEEDLANLIAWLNADPRP